MADINRRSSFMIEDLLECHRKLEEAKKEKLQLNSDEIRRNSYSVNHESNYLRFPTPGLTPTVLHNFPTFSPNPFMNAGSSLPHPQIPTAAGAFHPYHSHLAHKRKLNNFTTLF